MKSIFKFSLVATCLAMSASLNPALGAPITAGDLVIYRVGDGAAALGTTATAVFLDEYSVSGTLIQSIALPTASGNILTAVGNSSTEGVISRSQDGLSLVFTGYRKAAGSANPSSDTAATTGRVIGTVDSSGTVDTSIALTDAGGNGTIRSATTVDKTTFYTSASSGFVRYIGTPSGASTSVLIDSRNSRQLNLSGNTLFAANGSTSIAGKVQTYGTLPTGATTPTAIVNLATANAVNGFALFDLNPLVAGDDTLYALDTVANLLLKYTFNGTAWAANGSISAGSAQNLTGYATGTTVSLYLTSGSTLFGYSDASGIGGTVAGSLASITTAGANTGFRGIGMFAAVPEPSTLAMAAIGGVACLFALRRRR